MYLYLVQHAEAQPKEEAPERPLSDKGRAEVSRVAEFIRDQTQVRVTRIIHSGKLRARQTAEILEDYLQTSGGITESDGLAPLDDPTMWVQRLKDTDADIVLVGHLPHLSQLAALLLTGDAEQPVVAFQMGGIVCLGRNEEGAWSLRWMLVPALLSK
ncbi:MAG: phosphohistidine phosphatase SixA [Fidelibacterota bacterium]|nr:MAG: phosphohistidine phosphatase SixA [Candidatus Neomarinimicrobiota bacterium]